MISGEGGRDKAAAGEPLPIRTGGQIVKSIRPAQCRSGSPAAALRFDLAPPGAFWYRTAMLTTQLDKVLISLPPEHSGIASAEARAKGGGFDLAPPGAFWYQV